jgi:hypothetical protein
MPAHKLGVALKIAFPAFCVALIVPVAGAWWAVLQALGAFSMPADFRVRNKTPEALYVTPVGTAGRYEDPRETLLVYSRHLPGIRATRNGDIRIDPGGEVEIIYDCDDVNLT